MVTEAEQQDRMHARLCIGEARARHWPSVEKFSGTRLYVDEDYGWVSLSVHLESY